MQHGMKGGAFRMGGKVPSKRLRLSLAPSDPAGTLNDETLAAAAANCEQLEQVRDELAGARFRMRAVLDTAGDEYLLIDRDRRVLDLNEIVLRALGMTRSDCIGQHFWDLVASAGYRAAVDKAIQRDRPVQLDTASAFIPGRTVRLAVLPDDEGLVLFGRDISGLTHAAETSDGQIALLQSVIETASDHVLILDSRGNVVFANKAPAGWGEGSRHDHIFMAGIHYRDIVDAALDGDLDLVAAIERLLSGKGLEFRGIIPIGPGADGRHADVRVTGLENARFRVILCWRLRERAAALAGGPGEPERLLLAREDERRRVARELHDSVQQDLAAIELGLHNLKRVESGELTSTAVSELQGLLSQTQIDVRTSTFLMHPPELGDGNLSAALERMIAGLMRRTSLKVDFHPGRAGIQDPVGPGTVALSHCPGRHDECLSPRQGDPCQPAPGLRPGFCHP
jgi:signal transduction histidine kinase